MVHVFLSQENGVAVVAGLPKDLDSDLNVKVDLTFTALLKYSVGGHQCYNIAAISDLLIKKVLCTESSVPCPVTETDRHHLI